MSNSIRFRLTHLFPILMHNGRLADPLNEFAEAMKELTGKKKKTRQDLEQIQRLEFEGGMYWDPEVGPHLPAANIESCINDGARKTREGQESLIGVYCVTEKAKLLYKGPREVEKLWADKRFVDLRPIVNPSTRGRSMRCRPIFRDWSAEFEISYDPEDVNADDVVRWLTTAGRKVGICDGTPKFGRFEVKTL